MKTFIVIMISVLSFSAFAETAGIFCKGPQGKLVNALSGEWDTCQGELLTGKVCFKGSRDKAIQILNSSKIADKFEGTDGQYIAAIVGWKNDEIIYVSVDDANDWSEKYIIKRCK